MEKHIHIHLPAARRVGKTKDAGQYSKTMKKQYPSEEAMVRDLPKLEREGWMAIGEKKMPDGKMEYTFGFFKDTKSNDDASTTDSEENDAYIKGYNDALQNKPNDPAFHPGGEKKPSVTLKYAEGRKQGAEDRKKKGTKDDFSPRLSINGRKFVSTGKMRKDKADPSKSNAEYEEIDANGNRLGTKVWFAEGGKMLNDEGPTTTIGIRDKRK